MLGARCAWAGWRGRLLVLLCSIDVVRVTAGCVCVCVWQGKRVDAFLFKERSLVLRQKLYGASHRVVTDCAKDLTLQYSVVAMDLIRGGDTVESLKLLEKAQILSSSEVLFPEELPRKQLLAVMYNNFGCYYKLYVPPRARGSRLVVVPVSWGVCWVFLPSRCPVAVCAWCVPCRSLSKLHTAWKYLQKALLIESTVPGCHNPAGTHLNVCALLSQMGRWVVEHGRCFCICACACACTRVWL